MPGATFIRGEGLSLRTITSEDHEFVRTHWNDPAIRKWAVNPAPLEPGDVADFVDPENGVHFLVCREEEPVGVTILIDIFQAAGNGEIGYWITPDQQGNGYATEAADLILRHAFHDRGLEKVIARAFADNDGSKRVLEKSGFEREGRFRDHHYIDGERKDMLLFGLLRSEWEAGASSGSS